MSQNRPNFSALLVAIAMMGGTAASTPRETELRPRIQSDSDKHGQLDKAEKKRQRKAEQRRKLVRENGDGK